MVILLVIIVITFIFILGGGLVLLQLFSQKQPAAQTKPGEPQYPADKPEKKIGFRWSYIILPLVILLISIVITIYFYSKLPDAVVWRLNSNDSPPISRFQIVLWSIVPQLFLTLLAIVIAYGTTKISNLFNQASEAGIKLDTLLMVMSNMVIIPQLILLFAMLNIFSYNAFQKHISFIWWVSLAVIIAGVVSLSIFFIRAIRKMGGQAK